MFKIFKKFLYLISFRRPLMTNANVSTYFEDVKLAGKGVNYKTEI